jgi:N4-gp56 family major capsid protein
MAGQLWVTDSLGGHLTNNKLSKSIRQQNISEYVFKQFVEIKEDLGKKSGDTVYFDKTLKIDTKGGTLSETTTITENKWKVVKDSVTVTELGNSVPYTQKLEVLAEFDPENISTKALKDDQLEVLDSLAYDQFATGEFVAVCTNTATTEFTTNGTATITATANMSDKNVRDVVDYMEKKQIPKFSDGMYRSIVSVNSKRGIYDYLQAIAQYTTPEFRHKNEIGQYYNVRFVQDVQFLSDTKNSVYGEGIFFGQEAVLEAIAALPEVRMKIPTDYGRSKGVAWVGIEAFKKMWSLSNDDLNSTGKGIERIVRVTSA